MSIFRVLGKGFKAFTKLFKFEPKVADAGKKALEKASIFTKDEKLGAIMERELTDPYFAPDGPLHNIYI